MNVKDIIKDEILSTHTEYHRYIKPPVGILQGTTRAESAIKYNKSDYKLIIATNAPLWNDYKNLTGIIIVQVLRGIPVWRLEVIFGCAK